MRFHIAKLSINRSWVNSDEVTCWFKNPKMTTLQVHCIALSAKATFRLTLPRTGTRAKAEQLAVVSGAGVSFARPDCTVSGYSFV
jgi:hypothetical protein